jgi:hypothetical protein
MAIRKQKEKEFFCVCFLVLEVVLEVYKKTRTTSNTPSIAGEALPT